MARQIGQEIIISSFRISVCYPRDCSWLWQRSKLENLSYSAAPSILSCRQYRFSLFTPFEDRLPTGNSFRALNLTSCYGGWKTISDLYSKQAHDDEFWFRASPTQQGNRPGMTADGGAVGNLPSPAQPIRSPALVARRWSLRNDGGSCFDSIRGLDKCGEGFIQSEG